MSSVLKWNFIMEWLSQHNSLGKQGSWILHFLPRDCKHTEGNREWLFQKSSHRSATSICSSYLVSLGLLPETSARLQTRKDFLLMLGSLHLDPATKDQGHTEGPKSAQSQLSIRFCCSISPTLQTCAYQITHLKWEGSRKYCCMKWLLLGSRQWLYWLEPPSLWFSSSASLIEAFHTASFS